LSKLLRIYVDVIVIGVILYFTIFGNCFGRVNSYCGQHRKNKYYDYYLIALIN